MMHQNGCIWYGTDFYAIRLILRWPLHFAANFLSGKLRASQAVSCGARTATLSTRFVHSVHLTFPLLDYLARVGDV
jgi:hypothetical protein